MTPAKVRALALRVAAAVPAGVPQDERVAVLLPDNGRGPPPGRYPVDPEAVVVIAAPTSSALEPRP